MRLEEWPLIVDAYNALKCRYQECGVEFHYPGPLLTVEDVAATFATHILACHPEAAEVLT